MDACGVAPLLAMGPAGQESVGAVGSAQATTAVASAMVGRDQRVVGDMALSGLEVGRWLDRRDPRLTREW